MGVKDPASGAEWPGFRSCQAHEQGLPSPSQSLYAFLGETEGDPSVYLLH